MDRKGRSDQLADNTKPSRPALELSLPFERRIIELEAENARLRADAARWNYIRLECSQIGSAIMSGQHYWRFRQPHGLQGPTIDSAMDNAMRERPLLAAALAGKET